MSLFRLLAAGCLAFLLGVGLSSCSQGQQPAKSSTPSTSPAPSSSATRTPGPNPELSPNPPHANITMPPEEEMRVEVPKAVQERWKAVVLTVVDRERSTVKDYTVSLGDTLKIPGSDLEVEALTYLPDFRIQGNLYTTASDKPLNPAVQVRIREGGKEIFRGWLFQQFPTMHPFQHQRFGITLKEGVAS